MATDTFGDDRSTFPVERSSEEIRQDIAKGEENLTQTVEQIGERIKEKLDWREYVAESPYLAVGIAAGIGYLASRMLVKRPSPMERIVGSVAEEVRGQLDGMGRSSQGADLLKVTLLGIATKAAVHWVRNRASSFAPGAAPPRV